MSFVRSLVMVGCLALATPTLAAWNVFLLRSSAGFGTEAHGTHTGRQVGIARFGDQLHASIWSGTSTTFIDLNPAGAESSFGSGIHGAQQVGYAVFANVSHAALWSGSSASFVSLHPAGAQGSVAYSVSNGVQVGYVDGRAAMWSGTAASHVNLHPVGFESSEAYAGGASMQAGYVDIGFDRFAALWTGSAASFVNLHPAEAWGSVVRATDGQVQGGEAVFDGQTRACIWTGTAGSHLDLHPEPYWQSQVLAVAGGHQVGIVDWRAAMWSGSAGSHGDLHSLLPPGFSISGATGIDVDGDEISVSGWAVRESDGQTVAILWKRDSVDFALNLNKTVVAGQNYVQGAISRESSLNQPLTAAVWDDSSLVTTPTSVTIPAGSGSKNFAITTTAVNSPIFVTIYAKFGTAVRSKPLTLAPLVPTAMAFTPSQVTGGQSTSCRLVINGVAGPSGRTIAMFDNSPHAATPSTVTVPPGASSVTFPITTTNVTSLKTVTVTARVSAGEKTGNFRIAP